MEMMVCGHSHLESIQYSSAGIKHTQGEKETWCEKVVKIFCRDVHLELHNSTGIYARRERNRCGTKRLCRWCRVHILPVGASWGLGTH
jgi:hypothetical protein